MKINPAETHEVRQELRLVPGIGKDEMNLVEFPFGPIRPMRCKTYEIEHPVFDRGFNREVIRKVIVTGSDAFGLPRPVDDQVLVGMKTLTHEAGHKARRVEFSRYHLCRIIGWKPDGRSYQRLEESLDRIAGTTLKFKDAWWDKGEKEWKSKTFHLIEEVDLCSRDFLDKKRKETGRLEQKLCSFVWNDVIWKSFQDGYIKTLDMNVFRRIAQGHGREVPLRLFRILDKRFHYGATARFELRKLCVGTLGLSPTYSPSQMVRILKRSVDWLIECEYLCGMDLVEGVTGRTEKVVFRKKAVSKRGNPVGGGRKLLLPESSLWSEPGPSSKELEEQDKIETFLRGLSRTEKIRVEKEAIGTAERHLADGFNRSQKSENLAAAESYRQLIVKRHILRLIKEQNDKAVTAA